MGTFILKTNVEVLFGTFVFVQVRREVMEAGRRNKMLSGV